DGIGDLLAAMAGRDAEEPGRSIDDLVAAIVPEVHPFGANDHLWIVFEIAVRRKRHPVLVERNALRHGLFLDGEFGMAHVCSPSSGPQGAGTNRTGQHM